MEMRDHILEEARVLVERLERISADSVWAHRSSGLRGTLLRLIDQMERSTDPISTSLPDEDHELYLLKQSMKLGFDMLVQAGREKVK